MYEERRYRNQISSRFCLEVAYQESDLFISSSQPLDEECVQQSLRRHYDSIADYVANYPLFFSSFSPFDYDEAAPAIIQEMIKVSQMTGIGPFASVAGAVAQFVGQDILKGTDEVIVENGGDIFLKIKEDKKMTVSVPTVRIFENMAIKIKKKDFCFGIASSSSRFGHSYNLGKADLVTIIAQSSLIADGFATALSNRIKKEEDIPYIIKYIKNHKYLHGILILFADKVFLWGDMEIENVRSFQ
jgi:ApbE superfamily uncharacterized protein (UPF0280 family)